MHKSGKTWSQLALGFYVVEATKVLQHAIAEALVIPGFPTEKTILVGLDHDNILQFALTVLTYHIPIEPLVLLGGEYWGEGPSVCSKTVGG